jgi:hypothetical protein
MTCIVYVGRLDDGRFRWEGGNWDANFPSHITRDFPTIGRESKEFWELRRRIESGRYEGKQTDWGCWVARVKRAEILAFIQDMYGHQPGADDDVLPRQADQSLEEIVRRVRALDPETLYALVAYERT